MVTASERRTHASERVIAPELQDLLLTHQGKWVAMTKTKLLAVGDSPDEVLHGAAELGERRPILYFVPRNGHTKLFFQPPPSWTWTMRFRGHERAEGLFSPMLDVEFRFADDPRIYLSVVDSGADYTMIPAEFLPPSISYDDLPDPMVGFGVGCEFEFKACAVEAWFQKWKFSNQVFVIAPKLMKEPTALLGRLDFLARFTVWFDWSEEPGLVDVKPIDKKGKH